MRLICINKFNILLRRYLQARSLKVSQQQGAGGTVAAGPVPQPPRTNKLPPMDAQKNQQTDEILNAILPPRYMVVLSACSCTLCLCVVGLIWLIALSTFQTTPAWTICSVI